MNKHSSSILIVDDDLSILDAVETLLTEFQYKVYTSQGDHVFEFAQKNKPDVILLDIWMSGHDGREICKQLKADASTQSIPVIIFSANQQTEKIAKEIQADGYLAKPFEVNALLNIIEKYTS